MAQIASLVQGYMLAFPEESERLRQLADLLSTVDESHLTDRSYFQGHITASAIVLSPCGMKALVKYQDEYGMWLQPGRHMKPEDGTPLRTARLAVAEKVGIRDLQHIPFHAAPLIPIDIDTHAIPDNTNVREPRHFHHDFRYLFVAAGNIPTDKALNKRGFRWMDLTELARFGTFCQLNVKIQQAKSQEFAVKLFFDTVVEYFSTLEQHSAIVVSHILPGTPRFVEALSRLFEVKAILPKPNSIAPDVLQTLNSRFNVVSLRRQDLNTQAVLELLGNSNRKAVLFDVGGYFAPVVANDNEVNAIAGVVEDTENGHKKYAALKSIEMPVVSVARSPLKDNEDFLVGQSVLFSADAILRDLGRLIQYSKLGIMGFGKIGRSILYHALQRNIRPLLYDPDPVRAVRACNVGAQVVSREELFLHADVIFSATGSKSLDILAFRQLRPGTFVFSVTSSDDEFDLRLLSTEYHSEEINSFVTKYWSFHNHFFLVNKGNAVNFIHKAALGNYIHLVRAEMIANAAAITQARFPSGLQESGRELRTKVAQLWLDTFNKERPVFGKFAGL